MRKFAFLSVAFALVAVSFYGCDETLPTQPAAVAEQTETPLFSPTFPVKTDGTCDVGQTVEWAGETWACADIPEPSPVTTYWAVVLKDGTLKASSPGVIMAVYNAAVQQYRVYFERYGVRDCALSAQLLAEDFDPPLLHIVTFVTQEEPDVVWLVPMDVVGNRTEIPDDAPFMGHRISLVAHCPAE